MRKTGKGGGGGGGGGTDSDIQIVDRGLVWQTSCPVTRGESQALSHALFHSFFGPLLAQKSCQVQLYYNPPSISLFSCLLAW